MYKDYAKAISRIAWAYFFSTFHIKLGTIDILPVFVRYIMMYTALQYVGQLQPSALLLKPLVAGLVFTGIIDWVLTILSVSVPNYIYPVIVSCVYIYVHFQLMTDIYHTIEDNNLDSGGSIPLLRNITTISYTLWFMCQFFTASPVLLYGSAIVNIVMKTCLMCVLWSHSSYLKKL